MKIKLTELRSKKNKGHLQRDKNIEIKRKKEKRRKRN